MAVKFKIRTGATEKRATQILEHLSKESLRAEPLFPGQKRSALARVFVIPGRGASPQSVRAALSADLEDIEYVEGEAERKPMGSV